VKRIAMCVFLTVTNFKVDEREPKQKVVTKARKEYFLFRASRFRVFGIVFKLLA